MAPEEAFQLKVTEVFPQARVPDGVSPVGCEGTLTGVGVLVGVLTTPVGVLVGVLVLVGVATEQAFELIWAIVETGLKPELFLPYTHQS